jgi:hypothetical protein
MSVFAVVRHPSMFVEAVISKYINSKKTGGHTRHNPDVLNLLSELILEFPSWLSLHKTKSGTALRANKPCTPPSDTIMSMLSTKYGVQMARHNN